MQKRFLQFRSQPQICSAPVIVSGMSSYPSSWNLNFK